MRAVDPIIKAWAGLLALSLCSVLVGYAMGTSVPLVATGGVVLVLSWLKARIILSRYLGLWQSPGWRAGFNWGLGVLCLMLLALYLIPALWA